MPPLTPSPTPPPPPPPPRQPLPLLFADDSLLVLHKPAGLLSVPGRGEDKQDCLSARVQAVHPEALVVHRLDMATSGLMLLARSPQAQAQLQADFAARRVYKGYTAVVAGDCRHGCASWQTIDLPILLDWPHRPLRKIDLANGKPSLTRWRCLDYDADADTSLLALEPRTGRSHQLRLHLCALGHPILGDPWYAPPAVAAASERLLLHADSLAFAHPVHGQWVAFHCAATFAPRMQRCPPS